MTQFVKLDKPGAPLFVNPALVAGVTAQDRPGSPRSLVNVFGREYSVYGTPGDVLAQLGIELPGVLPPAAPPEAVAISPAASTAGDLGDTL